MRSESTSFSDFIKDVRGKRILTRKEEAVLGRRILKGDEGAIETLALHNIRFVISEGIKFKKYGVPLEDVVQEGVIGLFAAAKKFDYRKGSKFISYARWSVLESMQLCISVSGRTLKLPKNTLAEMSKHVRAKKSLVVDGNATPSPEDISARSGANIALVNAVIMLTKDTVSLNDPLREEYGRDGVTRMEMLADDTSDPSRHADMASMERSIQGILGCLTDRQKLVIEMRFGLGVYDREYTLEEVAAVIGTSRERPRQIQNEAIDNIVIGASPDQIAEFAGMFGISDDRAAEIKAKHINRKRDRYARKNESAYKKRIAAREQRDMVKS